MEMKMTDVIDVPKFKNFKFCISDSGWDVTLSDPPLDAEDLAWFKEEMGLSRKDLLGIFARAKSIERELKPNDELLDLTYWHPGNWYIEFSRRHPQTNGRWRVYVYRDPDNFLEKHR